MCFTPEFVTVPYFNGILQQYYGKYLFLKPINRLCSLLSWTQATIIADSRLTKLIEHCTDRGMEQQ